MPKELTSPFTPGVPVTVDFFVGRINEVERLRRKAASAKSGRIEVGFLLGERGIGKSSLAAFAKYLLERESNMIGLHIFFGGVTSLEETVRRIFDRLVKESVGTTWQEKVKKLLGNYIRQVDLFGIGVEFRAPDQDLRKMAADFAPALHELMESVKEEKAGVFLIMDDINGLASSQDFANWLKSLIDEIATSGNPVPLYLLLVGLEERRRELVDVQPSLARVFDLVEIRDWSDEETNAFYQNAFSSVGIHLTEEALQILSHFTGGLPVFAHEIGDAAFQIDKDGRIDESDAYSAVINAAETIGHKYVEAEILQAIRSPTYRSILRKLAMEPLATEFTRRRVRARFPDEEAKGFDNFLRRMEQLGVIRKDPERGSGAYQFTNILHRVYFWLEAEGAKEKKH